MKSRLALVLVVLSLSLGGVGTAQTNQPQVPPLAGAKTCGRGYVHAVIDHKQKCLRAGQFCAARFERQYRHYGFTCRAGHLRRR